MKFKKEIDYNGKKIFVYDNIFARRENFGIYNVVVNAPFTRTNIDVYLLNNLDRDVKWWSVIDPKGELSSLINPKYVSEIDVIDWNIAAITGQYINYSTSNTVDQIHSDVSDDANNAFTILHYINHSWNPSWHGETVFYSDDCQETVYTQVIKPGTVLVFDSRIQHSAVPCTITAEHPRYTIATKIFLKF